MADTRYIPFDEEDRFPKTHNVGQFLKQKTPKECILDIMNIKSYLMTDSQIVGIRTKSEEQANQLTVISVNTTEKNE
jgi:hypothetical protein